MGESQNAEILRLRAGEVMETNFLDYAMSVITDRALPDVRDGLKPVHRRILYAMHQLKIGPGSPHKKSARVVGEVIGKYHPHGDSAAYDAAVRLAQPWSMQHPLIDGQGNFGSIDGDSPAAMRYTEMRLSRMGAKLFADIEKETVDFRDNYDGSEREPVVLPVAFPQLWVNGSEGIAVGMATSVPPHNLREVREAFLAWLENPELTTAELVRHMPGPDFPTGGLVHGLDGYRQALDTGRGRVKLRARWSEEERKGGGSRLVIYEVPYLSNKAKIVEDIAELVRERKLEGVSDLRDESNKKGIRIVLDLKRGTEAELIALHLMALTNLEVSVSYNVMALVDGEPHQLGVRDVFRHFHDHRIEVIQRRTQHDLDHALARLHVLEGYLAALDRLDETIETIRASQNADDARTALEALLGIDNTQAQAILDLRLQRLTGMQIQDIRDEHTRLTETVADYRDILARPERQRELLVDELTAVADTHGGDRVSEIAEDLSGISSEDLVPVEDVLLIATEAGYLKRLPVSALNRQNRGTRGRSLMQIGEDDVVTSIHSASTHDHLLAITETGQVHAVKVWQIPESGIGARGRHYRNVFEGLEGHVVAMLSTERLEAGEEDLVIVTREGYIKRTELGAFVNATRRGGVLGVSLDEGDAIVAARLSEQEDSSVVVVGSHAKAIRFALADVRRMGRAARGVRAIKLPAGAHVIAAEVVGATESSVELACISEKGLGKRTAIEQYSLQGRGGQGVTCYSAIKRSGALVSAAIVRPGEDVVVFNDRGGANRVSREDIPRAGRATAGATMIRNGRIRNLVAVPESRDEDDAESD